MTGPARPRLFLNQWQGAALTELCADGASNTEIARRLGVRPGTVKASLKNVMRSAGCSSRSELAVRVLRGQFVVRVMPSGARQGE